MCNNIFCTNYKIVILAIAGLLWYRGCYRIIDSIIEDNWLNNILMILLAVCIFISDNLVFDEIKPCKEENEYLMTRK